MNSQVKRKSNNPAFGRPNFNHSKFPQPNSVKESSGLIQSRDVIGYKKLDPKAKRKARERATKLLQCMSLRTRETSILPPYLIRELWMTKVHYKDIKNFELLIGDSFDGGTVFWIENKS